MQKLYALTCTAKRASYFSKEFNWYTTAVLASSKDEAVGKGLRIAQEEYPRSGRYYDHSALAVEIPEDYIRAAYAELPAETPPQQKAQ